MKQALIRETDGFVENVIIIDEDSDWIPPEGYYLIDSDNASPGDTWDGEKFITPEPQPTDPPKSSYVCQLASIDVSNVRPAQVKRIWEERDCFLDCFVTETIKDMYLAGNIQVGDWVLVHFDDRGEQLVTEKIYKSW